MIFVRSSKKNNLVTIQIPIYALYRLPLPPLRLKSQYLDLVPDGLSDLSTDYGQKKTIQN